MAGPEIRTPRGRIYIDKNGNKAILEWNTDFQPFWQRKFTKAQVFVDSEFLRVCEPYTPLLTGMLIKSGTLGTTPGEGVVRWIAPYSRRQYYLKRKTASQTGPLRGSRWGHRAKEAHGQKILRGARHIMRTEGR